MTNSVSNNNVNNSTLLRAQATTRVAKPVAATTAVAAQVKSQTAPADTAIQSAKIAGSSSGNLPRGSLVDILA